MVVRRERVVAAAPGEVWRVVSDPATGCPPGGRASRASRRRAARRGRRCSCRRRASRCAPTTAWSRRASRSGVAVAPGGGGVAVRAAALRVDHRDRAGGGSTAARGAGDARPAPARLGALQPFQLRAAAPARRRGARGAGGAARGREPDALVGLGRGRARRPAAACGRGAAARRAGRGPGAREAAGGARSRCGSRTRRCRRAGARAAGRGRWAPSTCDDDREAASRHAVGRSTRTWCGCAPATPRARPTPWCCPARPSRWRPCSRRAPSSGWRSSRSAAARAWWAAWSRCATAWRRRSRSTCAGSTDGRGGPHLAHRPLDAGLLGPEAERRLGERGRDARPLPAVVRVLDRGRLGGHALGGPGVHRLRADRRAGGGVRCVTPAGELGTRAVPASAAGPGPARAGGGLRRACSA